MEKEKNKKGGKIENVGKLESIRTKVKNVKWGKIEKLERMSITR